MRKSRFSEAQIGAILKELKAGKKPPPSAANVASAKRRFITGAPSTAA